MPIRRESVCDDEICDRTNVVTREEGLAKDVVTIGGGGGREALASTSSINGDSPVVDPDEVSNYLSINNSRSSSCCDIPEETSPMISNSSLCRNDCGVDLDDLETGFYRRTEQLRQQARRPRADSSDCCEIEVDTGAEEDEEEDDSMLTSTNSAATTATVTSSKSQLNVVSGAGCPDTSVNIVDNPVSDSNEHNSVNSGAHQHCTGTGAASGGDHPGGSGGPPPQHSKITTTPSNLSNCSGLPTATVVQLKQKQNLLYYLRVIFNHCKVNNIWFFLLFYLLVKFSICSNLSVVDLRSVLREKLINHSVT